MSERFLKFIPSEEAMWLLDNKINAFRLLTHIANTARRYDGHPDGLKIGQCHLQHWKKYNLTEREYRTAKDILVKRSLIKIIETNRTRKKSTTGSTTGSTLVELCGLTVWDINPESNDDRIDDRATTDRRLTDDKQERIRKIRKNKNTTPNPPSDFSEKRNFRENVALTQKEFDTLLSQNGQKTLDEMLDILDAYKGSTGKAYKSDYHTLVPSGWVAKRILEDASKIKPITERKFLPSSNQDEALESFKRLSARSL
jgi:hypothetical protein